MFTYCTSVMPVGSVQGTSPTDPCVVVVYNMTETDSHISVAKTAAIDECKQNINDAKGSLTKEINKLPATVIEALKAQIKEEIKAEVIKEVLDDIKTGKVKPPPTAQKAAESHNP